MLRATARIRIENKTDRMREARKAGLQERGRDWKRFLRY